MSGDRALPAVRGAPGVGASAVALSGVATVPSGKQSGRSPCRSPVALVGVGGFAGWILASLLGVAVVLSVGVVGVLALRDFVAAGVLLPVFPVGLVTHPVGLLVSAPNASAADVFCVVVASWVGVDVEDAFVEGHARAMHILSSLSAAMCHAFAGILSVPVVSPRAKLQMAARMSSWVMITWSLCQSWDRREISAWACVSSSPGFSKSLP